jgi:sarcosine oxidase, subunit beta
MATNSWIEQAQTVVIGGGVIGCSVAYHLARAGLSDVLVMERGELGGATTARSAGHISLGRADLNMMRMARQTQEIIPELEREVDVRLDFHKVGNLRVAFSAERVAELERLSAALASEGVTVQSVDVAAARELCPWLDVSRAGRLLLLPDAGYIDGPRLAMAYAQAARARGVRLWRGVAVEDIVLDGTIVAGVRTERGIVHTPRVILAAGAWSPQLAQSIGRYVAAAPTRSHFWITAPNDAGKPDQPNVTLPDYRAYTRKEMGGLLIGLPGAGLPDVRSLRARRGSRSGAAV